jgi:hypothetical protein
MTSYPSATPVRGRSVVVVFARRCRRRWPSGSFTSFFLYTFLPFFYMNLTLYLFFTGRRQRRKGRRCAEESVEEDGE